MGFVRENKLECDTTTNAKLLFQTDPSELCKSNGQVAEITKLLNSICMFMFTGCPIVSNLCSKFDVLEKWQSEHPPDVEIGPGLLTTQLVQMINGADVFHREANSCWGRLAQVTACREISF